MVFWLVLPHGKYVEQFSEFLINFHVILMFLTVYNYSYHSFIHSFLFFSKGNSFVKLCAKRRNQQWSCCVRLRVTTCIIIGCVRLGNPNLDFENGFHFWEIRPQGGFQLRNPNPDFMDFLLPFDWGFTKLFLWTVVFFLWKVWTQESFQK